MSDVNLDRIESRCLEFMDRMGGRIQKARFKFPYTDTTVGFEELARLGASFFNCLMASAWTDGRVDSETLDPSIGEAYFWKRSSTAYGRYGGYAGVQSAAKGADPKGIQGVFSKVADDLASEMVQTGIGSILESEVDQQNDEDVRSLALQLQRKAGISGTPLFRIMVSWKDLVLARVMMKWEMRKRFGQI